MNHLLVICHPRPESFVRAVGMICAEALEAMGHEVRVRDLCAVGFDPVLSAADLDGIELGKPSSDILYEQAQVAWAEVITLVHPLWLNGLPAMLKGYLDRVFSHGFAYGLGEHGEDVGLLKGKKVALITTTGGHEAQYARRDVRPAMDRVMSDNFRYCGLEDLGHLYLWGVPHADNEGRRRMLTAATDFVTKTCSR